MLNKVRFRDFVTYNVQLKNNVCVYKTIITILYVKIDLQQQLKVNHTNVIKIKENIQFIIINDEIRLGKDSLYYN